MLLNLCIMFAFLPLTAGEAEGCVDTLPTVTVERVEDLYRIQLIVDSNLHSNILSWDLKNAFGLSVANSTEPLHDGFIDFAAEDCENTQYKVGMNVQCGDEEVVYDVDTVEFDPIPVEELSNFNVENYGRLEEHFVRNGEEVTLNCQAEDLAAQLQEKYGFVASYTWIKEDFLGKYEDEYKAASTEPFMVLSNPSGKDAGHFYCKIRRCKHHKVSTPACNDADVTVQSPVPGVVSRKCRIFGDPHVLTFDGKMYSYRGECWYIVAMSASYSWFLYGEFTPCGPSSSCLESVTLFTRTDTNPGGSQVQLLRGYGAVVNGVKTFFHRGQPTEVASGITLEFTGDKLVLSVPEQGLQLKWDGLSGLVVYLNKDQPSLGLCGDNNGDPTNDFNTYMDGLERETDEFGDAWAIPQGQVCRLSGDFLSAGPAPILTLADLLKSGLTPNTFPVSYLRNKCREIVYGGSRTSRLKYVANQLSEELVNFYIEACVTDTQRTEYGFFDKAWNFPGCIVMTMLAEEAGDLGLSVTDWQKTSTCAIPRQWRDESIRVGCVWTGTDWSIVTS